MGNSCLGILVDSLIRFCRYRILVEHMVDKAHKIPLIFCMICTSVTVRFIHIYLYQKVVSTKNLVIISVRWLVVRWLFHYLCAVLNSSLVLSFVHRCLDSFGNVLWLILRNVLFLDLSLGNVLFLDLGLGAVLSLVLGLVLRLVFGLCHVLLLNLGFGNVFSHVMRHGLGFDNSFVLGSVQGGRHNFLLVNSLIVGNPFCFGLVLSVVTGHRVAWLWFVVAVLGSRRNGSDEK